MTVQTSQTGAWTCEHCGFGRNETSQVSCELCSRPREAAAAPSPRALPAPPTDHLADAFAVRSERVRRQRQGLLIAMVAGAFVGVLLDQLPLLSYIGWFVASLCHELGHSIAAWLAGMPATPAIRLDGHAAALHGAQSTLFALIVTGLVTAAAWQARTRGRTLCALIGAGAVLQLLYAFSPFKEVVFLYAGHLGELAFAGVFLWRGFSGGFTTSPVEQGLYAVFGGHLIWRNVWLSGGLLFSAERRAWYESSGSFGLRNDFLRLAEDVLHCRLSHVVWPVLILTIAVPFTAFFLARWHLRRRAEEAA